MVALLLVVSAMQQVGVLASIDRDRAVLGDTVTLTIRVEATSTLPIQIVDPILSGLERLGSGEQTHVSLRGNTATRLTIREISLVARRIGTATIGAVVVHVGDSVVTSEQITFTVDPTAEAPALTLDPRVREFVRQLEPPSVSDDAAVVDLRSLLDTVMLGDQLDVIVIAWFPRAVRSRLRTPPQLQPPQVRSAWGYGGTVLGVQAVSQRVRGVRYDLYVHHQALFPLKSGQLGIGPASVTYNLPVTFSFLSRELRHEVASESLHVYVEAQPAERRPAAFSGASGENLRLDVSASRNRLLVGDASVVAITVSGRGNVALWPEPTVRWPPGLRGYADDVVVTLEPQAGLVAGAKEFRYLVVADSSGTHRIPTPSYSYFDLSTKQYMTLRTPSIDIVATGPAGGTFAPPSEARPLLAGNTGSRAVRISQEVPKLVWLVIALLPPIIGVIARFWPTRSRRAATPVPHAAGELDGLKRTLGGALDTLVPDCHRMSAPELADALRAAGIDGSVAMHAARMRDRLWQAGYGPEPIIDREELAAEVHAVFRALTPRRVASTVGAVFVFLLAMSLGDSASAQSAERLYEAGAARAASDSFALRAAREPWNVSHWYNLGAALEQAGELVEARAAWLRAARLQPRGPLLRSAVRTIHGDDPVSASIVWVAPVTPAEALMGTAALWLLGWALLAARRRYGVAILVMVMAVITGAYGAYVQWRYEVPVALVRVDDTPVRAAPYGSAAARVALARGSAVKITRVDGSWALIERAGTRGWTLRSELVPL